MISLFLGRGLKGNDPFAIRRWLSKILLIDYVSRPESEIFLKIRRQFSIAGDRGPQNKNKYLLWLHFLLFHQKFLFGCERLVFEFRLYKTKSSISSVWDRMFNFGHTNSHHLKQNSIEIREKGRKLIRPESFSGKSSFFVDIIPVCAYSFLSRISKNIILFLVSGYLFPANLDSLMFPNIYYWFLLSFSGRHALWKEWRPSYEIHY